MRPLAILTLSGALGLAAPVAQAAGSMPEALASIATAIVRDLGTTDTPSLAVSTFTHSGNICSNLSNLISDTMQPKLMEASQRTVPIIARNQLSAIFREQELVYDGTISPNAAQEIGKISGVEAILTGSITPYGDQMIVTATLIATRNGAVLSSVQESFPITATERSMMEIQDGALCGFTSFSAAAGRAGAVASTPPPAAPQTRPNAQSTYTDDVYEAEIVGLYYAPSTGLATWSLRFSNTSETPIGLSYIPDSAVISDGRGGTMDVGEDWSGIRTCHSETGLGYCNTTRPQYATTLAPGKFAQLNFSSTGAQDLTDPALTLTMEMVVTPDTQDPATYSVRSLGFFDVVPKSR